MLPRERGRELLFHGFREIVDGAILVAGRGSKTGDLAHAQLTDVAH